MRAQTGVKGIRRQGIDAPSYADVVASTSRRLQDCGINTLVVMRNSALNRAVGWDLQEQAPGDFKVVDATNATMAGQIINAHPNTGLILPVEDRHGRYVSTYKPDATNFDLLVEGELAVISRLDLPAGLSGYHSEHNIAVGAIAASAKFHRGQLRMRDVEPIGETEEERAASLEAGRYMVMAANSFGGGFAEPLPTMLTSSDHAPKPTYFVNM